MKNNIAKLLFASGILLFLLGFVMNYYSFSSTSYKFSHRIHSVTENQIDGFSLKLIGFLVFIMGAVAYFDTPKKNTTNSNDNFKKARDIEKLMRSIKKNKK